MMSNRPLLCLTIAALLGACSSDSAPTDPSNPVGDASSPEGDTGAAIANCPAGFATLTMTVDDSANGTYADGELLWTGSFSFDAATNSLTYATAWQPTDGPYPPLWDDGPVSAGGHEPEGATAGDHVFGVSVCYLAEDDRLLAYGVLNDDLRWIWQGPNGLLDVPAGTTDQFDAEGLVIAAHGDRDIEVTLDLAALHPDYATIGLDTHSVYLKGSMNAWTPVQLLDNGQLGDAAPDDGILTYRHSYYAHGHIGLLRPGQEAQFVFVFAIGDLDPDLASEYKVNGEAAPEGTAARSLCLSGWESAEIISSPDSKGITLNTALVVCPQDPDTALTDTTTPSDCSADTPCSDGQSCVDGTCIADTEPPCGPDMPCPDGETCTNGDCVETAPLDCDDVPCDAAEVCVDGACVPAPEGDCNDQVPCTGPGEVCVNETCVVPESTPELVLLIPATGTEQGGTTVTLHGSGFLEGAVVTFGDAVADTVSITDDEAVVTSPAQALGTVDVRLTNPDGAASTFPSAFTYVEGGSAPFIQSVAPATGPSTGGTTVTITGANFAPGATVRFGTATASSSEIEAGGTSLSTVTPESPLGAVTVTVVNPDGQQGSLTDGFTYSPNIPDWGTLHGPSSQTVFAGVSMATLTAEVWEPMVTESAGAGFGLVAEVGYGPAGSTPSDDDSWLWSEAVFSHDQGNNEVWTGALAVPEGAWSATMRFSLGGEDAWLVVDLDGTLNGISADQLVALEGTPAPDMAIGTVSPSSSWPLGGQTITLEGIGFSDDCTASLDDEVLELTWGDPTLQFVAPPHAPGDATLQLDCPAGNATTTLVYMETWDGALSEWPAETQVATNTLPSSWSESNVLTGLHVASDGITLYVGVDGMAYGDNTMNAVVVYIDTDLGTGTGLTTADALTDTDHPVDDALGGVLQFTAPGFGAEVAFATLDMGDYTPEGDETSDAGWRGMTPADDLPWLIDGTVTAGANSLEASIPLAALYGEPTGEARNIGLIVRIASATGEHLADQALPEGVGGESNELAPAAAGFKTTY